MRVIGLSALRLYKICSAFGKQLLCSHSRAFLGLLQTYSCTSSWYLSSCADAHDFSTCTIHTHFLSYLLIHVLIRLSRIRSPKSTNRVDFRVAYEYHEFHLLRRHRDRVVSLCILSPFAFPYAHPLKEGGEEGGVEVKPKGDVVG